ALTDGAGGFLPGVPLGLSPLKPNPAVFKAYQKLFRGLEPRPFSNECGARAGAAQGTQLINLAPESNAGRSGAFLVRAASGASRYGPDAYDHPRDTASPSMEALGLDPRHGGSNGRQSHGPVIGMPV